MSDEKTTVRLLAGQVAKGGGTAVLGNPNLNTVKFLTPSNKSVTYSPTGFSFEKFMARAAELPGSDKFAPACWYRLNCARSKQRPERGSDVQRAPVLTPCRNGY